MTERYNDSQHPDTYSEATFFVVVEENEYCGGLKCPIRTLGFGKTTEELYEGADRIFGVSNESPFLPDPRRARAAVARAHQNGTPMEENIGEPAIQPSIPKGEQ